jgi:hypothetical protein
MRFLFSTMLLVTAALLVACGGSGRAVTTPTSGASGATAAPSAAAADVTSAATAPLNDDERSRAAATEIFHGVIDPACTMDHPVKAGFNCIIARSNAATLSGGIAVFDVAEPEAGDAGLGILGRAPDGTWKYWFGTQQPYALLALPGDMRVCADGDGLNLRTQPAATAPQVTLLADGTIVRGDGFVLTEPGTPGPDAEKRGYGWYHIAAPQEGWAYSRFLSNAQIGDCSLRDALERAR